LTGVAAGGDLIVDGVAAAGEAVQRQAGGGERGGCGRVVDAGHAAWCGASADAQGLAVYAGVDQSVDAKGGSRKHSGGIVGADAR
jgi:hypothetical protein